MASGTDLSKSLSQTRVLLRTPITQMIFFNQGSILIFIIYMKKILHSDLEYFSCILLISNHMIALVQFGMNKHL